MAKKTEKSKDVNTCNTLDKLIEDQLCIGLIDKDAHSRVESLFVSYQLLLHRNDLAWLTVDNDRIPIHHVFSAIRPVSLCTSLELDLELSHYNLRKNLKGFRLTPSSW